MHSSPSCVLSCDGRDEPVSAGPTEEVEVSAERQEAFTPGPFGRWALFLANTSRARMARAEETESSAEEF